jgi:formiminotetrahydrofolate cyclodeaminase
MEKSKYAAELSLSMAKIGNLNAISDAGIAGEMALSACRSASYNVLINLSFLQDVDYSDNIGKKHKEILKTVKSLHKEITALVGSKIKK